jgi:hypothetical protein
VTQVNLAADSLPLVNSDALISLHYTTPAAEVINGSNTVFDIETLDDDDLDYTA